MLGRDIYSRVLYGTRISLTVGLVGIVISFVLGIVIGGAAGYFGGWVDSIAQRAIEILRSIPELPLWLALTAALPLTWSPIAVYVGITIILALLDWPGLARAVRSKLLQLREEDYCTAAQLMGATPSRIIGRHLLPATLARGAIDADAVCTPQGCGEAAAIGREGQVEHHIGQAGEALEQAAAGAIEQVDRLWFAGRSGEASQGHQGAIGAEGHRIELALIPLPQRHPQHPHQLAAGQVPDAGGLVVGGRHRPATGPIHGDAIDHRGVHAGLDRREGSGGGRRVCLACRWLPHGGLGPGWGGAGGGQQQPEQAEGQQPASSKGQKGHGAAQGRMILLINLKLAAQFRQML
jgi:hypothetical protein